MQHLRPNTTLQGGKYRIERVLGLGGFGITYLAEQTSLERNVAIKEFFMKDFCSRDKTMMTTGSAQIVEQCRKKFVKEARNLARLSHPNIIGVIDIFEENDTVYYVMPYLTGGSLEDYVKKHGALPESEAMKYIRQIASALKYMHEEQHICHYDVKPANILLDNKKNAVLIDFGISKNYDASGHETTTTPIGMSEGYAPIEQYQQNVEDFSPVSDVYALGATLHFLLHGKRPISAVHRASGTELIISDQLSQEIKDLINISMKVSKRERAKCVDVFLKDNSFSEQRTSSSVESFAKDEETIIASVIKENDYLENLLPHNKEICRTNTKKYGLVFVICSIIAYISYVILGSQNNFFDGNVKGVPKNSIGIIYQEVNGLFIFIWIILTSIVASIICYFDFIQRRCRDKFMCLLNREWLPLVIIVILSLVCYFNILGNPVNFRNYDRELTPLNVYSALYRYGLIVVPLSSLFLFSLYLWCKIVWMVFRNRSTPL